jgi:hypothetical protein
MQKREQREMQQSTTDMLSKRSEWTELRRELANRPDSSIFAPSKKLVGPTSQLKIGNSRKIDNSDEDDSESYKTVEKPRYGNLDIEQVKCIDFFMVEVNKLISVIANKENKDPRRDEDLITLMSLKQFVVRYFTGDLLIDNITKLMRSKIKVNEMIMVLSSLKFKDKNPDMILVTVKQFTDIFLELIINPGSFKTSQINFYRGGKCIINIFIFLIKGYFQQVRIMRSIYCEEMMQNDVVHIFSEKEVFEILKVLVDTTIELAAIEASGSLSSGHQTSAFMLHSLKNSSDHAAQRQGQIDMHQPPENNILQISNDKHPFTQSILLKSGQCKTGCLNQYSFELGREMNSSDKHSLKGDDHMLFKHDDSLPQNSMPPFGNIEVPISGNYQSFVSNLLKKANFGPPK